MLGAGDKGNNCPSAGSGLEQGAGGTPGCSLRLRGVPAPPGCAASQAPQAASAGTDVRDCSTDPPVSPTAPSPPSSRDTPRGVTPPPPHHCSWCPPSPPALVPLCHQYLPPTATNTTLRLAALRDVMRAHGVQAYIVPSTDAHMVREQPARSPGDRPPRRCLRLPLTAPSRAPERVHRRAGFPAGLADRLHRLRR